MKIQAGISDRVHAGPYKDDHIPALGYSEPYGHDDPDERADPHRFLTNKHTAETAGCRNTMHFNQALCIERFYTWLRNM